MPKKEFGEYNLETGATYCQQVGGKCRTILQINQDDTLVYRVSGILTFVPLVSKINEFHQWANYRLEKRNNMTYMP
jgi:hypothetical protein